MILKSKLFENEPESSFVWKNNGDIIRKIGPDKRFIVFKNKEGKEVQISLLDLENIGDLSDDEISEMLRVILGITIQSPEGLNLINMLAHKALMYLKNELFYTDNELKSIGNIHFNNSSEIIKFFRATKKSNGIAKCMLLKIGMLLHEGISYEVEEKRIKTLKVLEKKVVSNLEDIAKKSSLGFENVSDLNEFLQAGKISFDGSIYIDNKNGLGARKINFKIEIREKTIESSISKALREKDYINQGDIMDLLGIRITTNSIEDKILVMDRISQLAFKYGEYRIKNKNGIKPDELKKILDESEYFTQNNATKKFIQALEDSFQKTEKRANTALNYSDIKIIPVGKGNKLSFEIQFLDIGHTNNTGLAHHIPFSYFRKIAERIRLEGYISEKVISRIANILIEDISQKNTHELGGRESSQLLKEILQDIYNELGEKYSNFKGKDISHLNHQQIKHELKINIPKYYKSRLIVFSDSKGNKSHVAKYTNKVGLENFSVLKEDDSIKILS